MEAGNRSSLRKMLTGGILVLLSVHVTLALLLTFLDGTFTVGNSTVGKLYDHLVHLGPFYRAETIQSSPHLFVQVNNGEAIDVIGFHLDEYRSRPWKINQLLLRDNVRTSAGIFLQSKQDQSSRAMLKLKKVATSVVELLPNDEVRWVYVHRYPSLANDTWKDDTLFNYVSRWELQ